MIPHLPSAVPEIPASDVAAAAAYYRDRLGFRIDWIEAEIGLAGVSRDECRLFLAGPRFREAYGNAAPALVWLNLNGQRAVDDLHRAWRSSDAIVLSAPESKPWGLHEFTAADPDGNRLRVFYDFATPERQRATASPRVTSFAPQFLVDDLASSIEYYRRLGFTFGEPWDGFYAIGTLDGLELHLKEAPKHEGERRHRRVHEHLDAAAGVDGIEAFYARCVENGATVIRPLAATAWGTKDFYVEDPDGYVISFGGRPTQE